MSKLSITVFAASALIATSAFATTTTYADRTAFNAAAGPIVTETFSSCGTNTVNLATNFVLSSANPGPCSSLQSGVSYGPEANNTLYIAGPGQSGNPTTALGVNFPRAGRDFINFSTPSTAFAADLNQNFGGGFQSGAPTDFSIVLLSSGSVVDSFIVSVASGTPTFFGVTSTTAFDEVTVNQIGAGFAVIDNVSFNGTSSVPEPGALALVGLGLGGLAFRRRRA